MESKQRPKQSEPGTIKDPLKTHQITPKDPYKEPSNNPQTTFQQSSKDLKNIKDCEPRQKFNLLNTKTQKNGRNKQMEMMIPRTGLTRQLKSFVFSVAYINSSDMGGRILVDMKTEFSWTKWVNSRGHFR